MNSAATQRGRLADRQLEGAGYIGSDILGGASAVSGEQGFPKGQYAMYIDGPWAVDTYAALEAGAELRHRAVPDRERWLVLDRRRRGLVISKGGKNLAAAEKFAQFLDSPFAQLAMAKVGQMSALSTTRRPR